jgi:hypothetical protein
MKKVSSNQIYIDLADIRQNYLSTPSYMISYSNQSSSMHRPYSVVNEQAQPTYGWNTICHGRNNDLSKVLPSIKMDGRKSR